MGYLEARDLAKSFVSPKGTRHVLRSVSLSVEAGEFVSIVGSMGSGKSTLLSLLAGLTTPDSGTIVVDGEPLRGIRSDAAYVFQNYSLLPWFSALENVRLAVGATFPQLSRVEQRARATETLERVGLGNALSRRPAQLSGGMRQRVALARAFATQPRVLFLDEPFGALDALTRETLQQDLATMCRDGQRSVTTIMITNSVEEAILLSDRIVPILPGPAPVLSDASERSRRVEGATLGVSIAVDLPRPRTTSQLAHDEQATQVRAHVIATLTASLKRPKIDRGASLAPGRRSLGEGGRLAHADLTLRQAQGHPERSRGMTRSAPLTNGVTE
jgi:nitrate/nitrite transport system ATP-binding protein